MFSKTDFLLKNLWHSETLCALKEFVSIQSLSPSFDPDWERHGELHKAIEIAKSFGEKLLSNIQFEILESPGRSPLLFFEIPAFGDSASHGDVLFYGHLDKQPEGNGWSNNRCPFSATQEDTVLYGRGVADDGYSFYSAVSIAKALESGGLSHPRIWGVFETCEESGSFDFSHWMQLLAPRLSNVALILVLDAGCIDYSGLYVTTNFRGILRATLKVSVLNHGVHSGVASGIVPDSFMIARNLLDRLEDSSSGKILDKAFYTTIPATRLEQLREKAKRITSFKHDFPWINAPITLSKTIEENLIAQTWLPQLTIIGAQGLPDINKAGNVLRASTSLKLSLRLPPMIDSQAAESALKRILLDDPPFGASVELSDVSSSEGWNAPEEAEWLSREINDASLDIFGKPAVYSGEGGTLSICNVFQSTCPKAQFLLTGVLGPNSNAHGPDEALRLDYVEKLCCALSRIIVRVP